MLPAYFRLWLRSCTYNPAIDFIVFTDTEMSHVPNNVKIVRCDIDMLKLLAETKLGMKVWLENAYKLCDFKPAYGIIFEDYLEEYDYWGYCDFDMIFGDIWGFLNRYQYYDYDKFLDKGHLAIYKNCPSINRAFQLDGATYGSEQAIDWKLVYSTGRNWIFDETNGIDKIFKKNGLKLFEETIYADVLHLWKRMKLWNLPNYNYQVFYWDKGKVYRVYWKNDKVEQEEFMYIHLQKRIMNADVINTSEIDNINSFYIGCQGFYVKHNGDCSMEDVAKYNPFKGILHENYLHFILQKKFRFSLYKKIARRRMHRLFQ